MPSEVTRIATVKLTLKIDDAVDDAVKSAIERKKSVKTETPEEAFERIGKLALTDKQRAQLSAATEAFRKGRIGNDHLRGGNDKISKESVLATGSRLIAEDEAEARKARVAETLHTKPDNFHIITDDNDLPRMIARLREEVRLQQRDEWFRKVCRLFDNTLIRRKLAERGINLPATMSLTVWDTETSGLDKMLDLSGGYSFWLPLLNEGYYVAYGHLTGEKQCTRSKALTAIDRFMALPEHVKSFHNAPYDLAILLNDGLKPQGVRYDSADTHRLLNEHEDSFGLKQLCAKYKHMIGLEVDDFTFEDLFGKESPMLHPIEVVGIYAIKDVLKGWALTRWQIEVMLATDNLHIPFFEIRQYLTEVNVNIERTGFVIDLEGLRDLAAEFRPRLAQAQSDVVRAYGVDQPEFLRKMDRVVNARAVAEWVAKTQRKADRLRGQIEAKRAKLAELEVAGKTHLKSYQAESDALRRYEAELVALPEPIEDNAPVTVEEFVFTNDNHLRYLIYDHLGIRDRTKEIAKDKSKVRAVSKDVLERYFDEEEALAPLAEVSMLEKLLGTYIEKIPEALDVDGRLHTQLDTVSTGRYSSKGYTGKPNDLRKGPVTDANYLDAMRRLVECPEKSVAKGTNVQNIPARTNDGTRVRTMFIPPPGHVYLGSDLSSIEPRLQAHKMAVEFGDEIFADMYRKGLDPYIEFAAILFDVDKALCEEKAYKSGLTSVPYRKLTKDMFLAKGYGQAQEQFVKTAVKRGIAEDSAKQAYAKFDEILPGFTTMVNASFEHLRKHGWTATLWHQKRRFPEYRENWRKLCVLMRKAGIRDKNDPDMSKKTYKLTPNERTDFWQLIRLTGRDERAAFNHEIQGSGANVLQLCMIRSYYECTVARGWEFVLTCHDEQKHAVPIEKLTREAVELYDDIMTNTTEFACPLACDSVIEPRWMIEYSRNEWDYEAGLPLPEYANKYN